MPRTSVDQVRHVTDRAMILECLDLGVDVIDHGDEVDAECIRTDGRGRDFWVPEPRVPVEPPGDRLRAHFGVTREAFDHVRRGAADRPPGGRAHPHR